LQQKCRTDDTAPHPLTHAQALPITVQVMSEAADSALRAILHHCQSLKLLGCVCSTVVGDKNAKVRMHCSSYLILVSGAMRATKGKLKELWLDVSTLEA
jgi:hypothetical protein